MAKSKKRKKAASRHPREDEATRWDQDHEDDGAEDGDGGDALSEFVVFRSEMNNIPFDRSDDIIDLYRDHILGVGRFEDMAEIRKGQGVPKLARAMWAGAGEGEGINNGDGFQIATRGLPGAFLFMRFRRPLYLGDLGPLEPSDGIVAYSLEEELATVQDKERFGTGQTVLVPPLKKAPFRAPRQIRFDDVYGDPKRVDGSLTEHVSLLVNPYDKRLTLAHTVVLVPPRALAVDFLDLAYTPEVWKRVLELQGTKFVDDYERVLPVKNGDDLRSLMSLVVGVGDMTTVLVRAGRIFTDTDATLRFLGGAIGRVGSMSRFFLLAPGVTDADIAACELEWEGQPLRRDGLCVIECRTEGRRGDDAETLQERMSWLETLSAPLDELIEPFQEVLLLKTNADLVAMAARVIETAGDFDLVETHDMIRDDAKVQHEAQRWVKKELSAKLTPQLAETNKSKKELRSTQARLKAAEGELRRAEIAANRDQGHLRAQFDKAQADLATALGKQQVAETALVTAKAELANARLLVGLDQGKELLDLMAEVANLRAALDTARGSVSILEQECRRTEGDNQDLRRQLRSAGSRIESFGSLTVTRSENSEPGSRREMVTSILGGAPSLEDGLLFLQEFFGDRLTVLGSALASAREADQAGFVHRAKAFALLKTLVTSYWEALATGSGGDSKARDLFGKDVYASREGDTGDANERMRRERTFIYGGTPVYMGRHLRLGVKSDTQETLRIHFHWDAEAKRIVVGHCGAHLYKLGF